MRKLGASLLAVLVAATLSLAPPGASQGLMAVSALPQPRVDLPGCC